MRLIEEEFFVTPDTSVLCMNSVFLFYVSQSSSREQAGNKGVGCCMILSSSNWELYLSSLRKCCVRLYQQSGKINLDGEKMWNVCNE